MLTDFNSLNSNNKATSSRSELQSSVNSDLDRYTKELNFEQKSQKEKVKDFLKYQKVHDESNHPSSFISTNKTVHSNKSSFLSWRRPQFHKNDKSVDESKQNSLESKLMRNNYKRWDKRFKIQEEGETEMNFESKTSPRDYFPNSKNKSQRTSDIDLDEDLLINSRLTSKNIFHRDHNKKVNDENNCIPQKCHQISKASLCKNADSNANIKTTQSYQQCTKNNFPNSKDFNVKNNYDRNSNVSEFEHDTRIIQKWEFSENDKDQIPEMRHTHNSTIHLKEHEKRKNIFDNKNHSFKRNTEIDNIFRRERTTLNEVFGKDAKEKTEVYKDRMNQRELLIHELSNREYECVICVSKICGNVQVFSCDNCYHIFHMNCFKKWSSSCKDKLKMNVRCPTCQSEYIFKNDDLKYTCFCKKHLNPLFQRGTVPYSCGDVCEKSSKTNSKCPHLCSILCHPGPCPPCESIVSKQCRCKRTKIMVKCSVDLKNVSCGFICGKILQCGKHKCENQCHIGDCKPCSIKIEKSCDCDRKINKVLLCGSEEERKGFSCHEICGRLLKCGNHHCKKLCHNGDCEQCQGSVEEYESCWCKKSSVKDLLGRNRQSCLEKKPNCEKVCKQVLEKCGHTCQKICHEDSCPPCTQSQNTLCRCKMSSMFNVKCKEIENGPIFCNKLCNQKLSCGKHRCINRCCILELHVCNKKCHKLLECKDHRCEDPCGHRGLCLPCPNVSFDELHCECGSSTILPPIKCSQPKPSCNKICNRNHECNHQVRHTCHNKLKCPPCTHLTSKPCPGNHKMLDNIPCFRHVVTCGLLCDRIIPGCNHKCKRICHEGECLINNKMCNQPCMKLRKDCNHPCGAPCHADDCESLEVKCEHDVSLTCFCKLKYVVVSCRKLTSIKSFFIFNNIKTEVISGLSMSLKDEKLYMLCDSDCKYKTKSDYIKKSDN